MTLQHILFPVDFSERSRAAAPFVLSMARKFNARVTLLHVIQPPPPIYGGVGAVFPTEFDYTDAKVDIEDRLAKFAEAEIPKVDTLCVVEIGDAGGVIAQYAESQHADLIAMPTHGYGAFRRMLLGSITAKVLHDSKIPVWTTAHAPEPSHRAHPKPRLILVAIDFKPESRHALETALELAQDSGAKVEVLHIASEGEPAASEYEARSRELVTEVAERELLADWDDAGSNFRMTIAGEGVGSVVRRVALEKRADLVVIGRGLIQCSGLKRLRANCYEIVREAPCPVLSV